MLRVENRQTTQGLLHQRKNVAFCAAQNLLSAKKIIGFSNEISKDKLEIHLKKLSSPLMEGRAVGGKGIEIAKEYIASNFKKIGLLPVEKFGLDDFFQDYTTDPYITSIVEKRKFTQGSVWCALSNKKEVKTTNVLGMLKGEKYPENYLIITAHYDHLGKSPEGIIFPGADDNASSVSALIEIAQAMKKNPPERSVIFAALSGEEHYKTGATALRKDLEKYNLKNNVEIMDLEMLGAQRGESLDVFNYKPKLSQKITNSCTKACKTLGVKIRTITPNPRSVDNNAESFSRFNLPSVCVTWDFYGKNTHPHLHTNLDTFENVNLDVFEKAAKTIGAASYIHANTKPETVFKPVSSLIDFIHNKTRKKIA